MLAIFLLLMPVQAENASPMPGWHVSGSPSDGLTFAVDTFSIAQGEAVDAALLAEAARRCAPLKPRLGSYTHGNGVDAKGRPTITDYRRLIGCMAADTVAVPPPSADWKPTARDEAAAGAAFAAFFAASDRGDAEEAMRLSDPGPWTVEQERAAELSFQAMAGTGTRTIYKLDWLRDPSEQPHRGIYVDVSYYGSFSRGKTVCGKILFYRKAEGEYLQSRNLMRMAPSSAVAGTGNPCP